MYRTCYGGDGQGEVVIQAAAVDPNTLGITCFNTADGRAICTRRLSGPCGLRRVESSSTPMHMTKVQRQSTFGARRACLGPIRSKTFRSTLSTQTFRGSHCIVTYQTSVGSRCVYKAQNWSRRLLVAARQRLSRFMTN